MSCNNKHDFPFATTVVGEVKDSFMASVGFENGKYLGYLHYMVEISSSSKSSSPPYNSTKVGI